MFVIKCIYYALWEIVWTGCDNVDNDNNNSNNNSNDDNNDVDDENDNDDDCSTIVKYFITIKTF